MCLLGQLTEVTAVRLKEAWNGLVKLDVHHESGNKEDASGMSL